MECELFSNTHTKYVIEEMSVLAGRIFLGFSPRVKHLALSSSVGIIGMEKRLASPALLRTVPVECSDGIARACSLECFVFVDKGP